MAKTMSGIIQTMSDIIQIISDIVFATNHIVFPTKNIPQSITAGYHWGKGCKGLKTCVFHCTYQIVGFSTDLPWYFLLTRVQK